MKRYSRPTTVSNFFISQSIRFVKGSVNFLLQHPDALMSLLLISAGSRSSDVKIHSTNNCRDSNAFRRCVEDYCKTDLTGFCVADCANACC